MPRPAWVEARSRSFASAAVVAFIPFALGAQVLGIVLGGITPALVFLRRYVRRVAKSTSWFPALQMPHDLVPSHAVICTRRLAAGRTQAIVLVTVALSNCQLRGAQ